MAPRRDLILFCDLETTGTEEIADCIIEVGISVMSFPAWEEVMALSLNILPTDLGWKRMDENAVVSEMHKANGLYEELRSGKGCVDEFSADAIIDEALLKFGSRGSSHIPLAGSGVSHFDRRFIKRYLPLFDARLTHWSYDVGVMRRMWQLVGAPICDDSAKTHRALDDARVHATEFEYYFNAIKGAYGAEA